MMINIAELLKDCPEDTKLYSILLGEVQFIGIDEGSDYPINVKDSYGAIQSFSKFGTFFNEYPDAGCLLFPSKDCRTWEGWKVPKPHYDIANFHAGMPVLVRDYNHKEWCYLLYSHYTDESLEFKFNAGSVNWKQCIPYNEETKHLLGTTDMCPEEYINW